MPQVVWLIDDCPLAVTLAKVRVRSLGADGYALPTGRAAIAAWTSGDLPPPGVVLLSPDLHSRDGLEAGLLLRDAGYTGLMLLHTKPANAGALAERFAGLVDDILLKPMTREAMSAVLEEAARRVHRAA